jgi:DNA polymerase-3 subunit epsilon
MLNFAAIDFETANQNRSSVCSVGLVIVEGGNIVDKYYHLIRPRPNYYCDWATEIHGLSDQDTRDMPEFPQVWSEVERKIAGLQLVAHYSSFDESCLRAAHELFGIKYPEPVFHCTCRAAKNAFPELPNHQLHTVAAHVNFDFNNHHHALADAEACAEIAKILID